jgi:quinol monooxygenase YgiN
MVVIAILECHFQPEKVDAGIDWLRRNLVATRAFDGCLGVDVFKDGDVPSRVIAVERWASLGHDRAYRAWRDGEGRIVEGGDLFAGPTKLTVGVVCDDDV